ncbi:MAG TPA: TonB-dependent receptor [Gemmatimonadales bacterium]|nr:TonB-dependent receptor [Gemmatimonadales bacterium]
MHNRVTLEGVTVLAALAVGFVTRLGGQQRDTTPHPSDTLRVFTLPPAVVSVTRANPPINRIPQAVTLVERTEINRARPSWGLDEALTTVPGVYAANRYNFSLDQRISIRGFGARAQFAVRGIKVLVDGIPQTLPDGTGQLTNLELGEADRIEVLRGSASALFGNATGGVISIWTDPRMPEHAQEDVTVTAGTFDRDLARNWSKWRSSTAFRLGSGSGLVTLSRLDYTGQRQHSNADLRNLNSRWHLPLANGWTLAAAADVGWDPRADNPGALTAPELAANPDAAAAINLRRNAGKDVTQGQGGVTLHRVFADGGDATVTLFGFTRDLKNPQTFAYINLTRFDYGARASVSHPFVLGALAPRVTAGIDFQRQRDDRVNYNYQTTAPTLPDTSRQLDQLEHVTEVGPFVQATLEVLPHVSVTGGLRYDWVNFQVDDRLGVNTGSRLMRAVSGAGGVAVTPSDAVTVFGNVGTSFETPTTTELVNRPNGATGFNPTLQPQRAVNYEVGVRGDVAGRVNYSLALFQADVRDELIPYQAPPPAAPGRVFYRNAGTSRHRGVELGAELVIVPGLNLFTTWTYSDFRYLSYTDTVRTSVHVLDGRPLPGIPQHWLHFLVQSRPGFARGAWAELEETRSSGFFVDDTLNTYTSGWWTTNLRLGWEGTVGSTRVRPFVGFNNVFNRGYVGSVVINAAGGRYYEPAPGRHMYVGFGLGAGE